MKYIGELVQTKSYNVPMLFFDCIFLTLHKTQMNHSLLRTPAKPMFLLASVNKCSVCEDSQWSLDKRVTPLKFLRNNCQANRSWREAGVMNTVVLLCCSLFWKHERSYSLRRNTLPGRKHLQQKLRRPTSFWMSISFTIFFWQKYFYRSQSFIYLFCRYRNWHWKSILVRWTRFNSVKEGLICASVDSLWFFSSSLSYLFSHPQAWLDSQMLNVWFRE